MTWIITLEQLPPQNVRVLLAYSLYDGRMGRILESILIGRRLDNRWFDDEGVEIKGLKSQACLITHWMPLPERPTIQPETHL